MVDWGKIKDDVERQITTLHEELGWFNDEELSNTPRRIVEFYKEWAKNNDVVYTTFSIAQESMIVLKSIDYYSLCAHHLLPFFGKVDIAYLPYPKGKIVGVSKLARAVVKIASKPQTQEYMTSQIAEELWRELSPAFLLVKVEGQHLCMMMRGIKQHQSLMRTESMKMVKEKKQFVTSLKAEALDLMR